MMMESPIIQMNIGYLLSVCMTAHLILSECPNKGKRFTFDEKFESDGNLLFLKY